MTILGLIVLAVASRLIPHPWNLTAVGAVALFSGAYLRPVAAAYLVPIFAFFISDLILGFHSTMIGTYGALALSVAMSSHWLAGAVKPGRVGLLSILSSLVFFVVSNLSVWWMSGLYSQDVSGLVTCFIMAIPFFSGQLIGDLLYSGVLFGVYNIASRRAQWVQN